METPRRDFTVGICATGPTPHLGPLVDSIIAEAHSSGVPMRKLIIVVSGCPPSVLAAARERQARDSRVHLVVEETRHGKAEAINRIIGMAEGEFLLFVNSDARPETGAMTRLISSAVADDRIGAVSAMPVPEDRTGLAPLVVDLMWSAHNDCSVALNHMNLSNHSCDEFVLFRYSAIETLPADLINDGAFLAIGARRKGYTIKVSPLARVHIQTPRKISDLVTQRRRIIFGHRQVWQKTGSPPRTVESMLLLSPYTGSKILVATLAKKPRLVLALPIAIVSELTASILSLIDGIRSSKRHIVWKRFT